MSFNTYTSIGEAAQAFRITLAEEAYLVPLPITVSEHLRNDLAFTREHVAFNISESAVCENLIYPILREVWKHYTDVMTLWSHMSLMYDEELSGAPDYFVARKSPLGHLVLDKPYLIIIEAKKDDFSRGWGQCLAAMVAAQRLNADPNLPVHGITTNGRFWEFGKLTNSTMTMNKRPYILEELELLCSALNYVFDQCRQRVADPSKAA